MSYQFKLNDRVSFGALEGAPKPKRKVTKTGWLNINNDDTVQGTYLSKRHADDDARHDRGLCREITWEVEVDE